MLLSPNATRRPGGALLAVLLVALALPGAGVLQAQTLYSHGDPSAQEQFFLELINRARANPPAEGARLGRAGEFAGYPVRPPLAFNPSLANAARSHNNYMAANNLLTHTGSDGSMPGNRAIGAGYPPPTTTVGENVSFGYPSTRVAFDALMIDAGAPGLEHRSNLLDFYRGSLFYRETGVALDSDARAFSTQLFGARGLALLTGVASRDGDGDNFYSPGEGVSGITVASPQSSFVTVTSQSGGYALPLDKAQDLAVGVTVVFRDAGGATYTRRLALTSTTGDGAPDNVKRDLRIDLDSPDAPGTPAAAVSVVGTPSRGGFVLSRRGADLSQALTVIFRNGGSAARGVDYEAFSGMATFAPGQTEALIPVRLLAGANRARKVKVLLEPSPTGTYAIGKAQSKVFLSDLP